MLFPLWKVLTSGDSVQERREWLQKLSVEQPWWGTFVVCGAVRDFDLTVRELAVETLGALGGFLAGRTLRHCLIDPHPRIRSASASALGQLGGNSAFQALKSGLRDPDSLVRRESAFSLGEIRDARAIRPLQALMHDSDPDVAIAAVEALASLEDPAAMRSLLDALAMPNKDVQETARQILCQRGGPLIIQQMIGALRHRAASVRCQAVVALRSLHPEEALPSLIEAVTDPDYVVRLEVLKTLSIYGGERARSAIRQATADPHARVRAAAENALRMLEVDPNRRGGLPSQIRQQIPSAGSSSRGKKARIIHEPIDKPEPPKPAPALESPKPTEEPRDEPPARVAAKLSDTARRLLHEAAERAREIGSTPAPAPAAPRTTSRGAAEATPVNLRHDATPVRLVRQLESDNEAEAVEAHEELLEHADPRLIGELIALAKRGRRVVWIIKVIERILDERMKDISDEELERIADLTLLDDESGQAEKESPDAVGTTRQLNIVDCSNLREMARRELERRNDVTQ